MGQSAFKRLKSFLSLLRQVVFIRKTGKKLIKPKVIQLPLTGKCNSKCLMCNVWKYQADCGKTIAPEVLSKIIDDELFSEIIGVGINGGEPSLIAHLDQYVDAILRLPKLKSLNIITNGFQIKFLDTIALIYNKCKKRNVAFSVSISLDGVGFVHDTVRGIKGAFNKAIAFITKLKENQKQYCDFYDIGATVIQQNVDYMPELSAYAEEQGLPIKFRLGIPNKRIMNEADVTSFSVSNNSFEQSAIEFFHGQMIAAKDFLSEFKYFAIYYWLTSKKKRRLLGCLWQEEGVTLDHIGNLYYCATFSEKIGNTVSEKAYDVFMDPKNISYRHRLIRKNCNNCIHDYSGAIWFPHFLLFFMQKLKDRFWPTIFKYKVFWQRLRS